MLHPQATRKHSNHVNLATLAPLTCQLKKHDLRYILTAPEALAMPSLQDLAEATLSPLTCQHQGHNLPHVHSQSPRSADCALLPHLPPLLGHLLVFVSLGQKGKGQRRSRLPRKHIGGVAQQLP